MSYLSTMLLPKLAVIFSITDMSDNFTFKLSAKYPMYHWDLIFFPGFHDLSVLGLRILPCSSGKYSPDCPLHQVFATSPTDQNTCHLQSIVFNEYSRRFGCISGASCFWCCEGSSFVPTCRFTLWQGSFLPNTNIRHAISSASGVFIPAQKHNNPYPTITKTLVWTPWCHTEYAAWC